MSSVHALSHIVLKKGAELLNTTHTTSIMVDFEKPLLVVLKEQGIPLEDANSIEVERNHSKTIGFKIGGVDYAVRHREYLILESEEERKRRDAKIVKRAKREEIKRLKAIAKGEEGKEDDDEIEAIEEEDEEIEFEGKLARDMYAIFEEEYGDDVEKYPEKIQRLVKRGQKLKEKLDRIEELFSRRFRKLHRKELKKYYGKQYRDENYGNVFQTVLEL